MTTHLLPKFGIAWRWEGRSMRKSPNSSVLTSTQFDLLVFPLVWHETATKAPVKIGNLSGLLYEPVERKKLENHNRGKEAV